MKKNNVLFILVLISGLMVNTMQSHEEEGGEEFVPQTTQELGIRIQPHTLLVIESGQKRLYTISGPSEYYEVKARIHFLKNLARSTAAYRDAQAILLDKNDNRVESVSFPSDLIKPLVSGFTLNK